MLPEAMCYSEQSLQGQGFHEEVMLDLNLKRRLRINR